MFGRIHNVEKDISGRQALLEGYLKRSALSVAKGEPVTNYKAEAFVLEAYNEDYLPGKYQQKNQLATEIRKLEDGLNKKGDFRAGAAAFYIRATTRVLKIPLNIMRESAAFSPYGAAYSSAKVISGIREGLREGGVDDSHLRFTKFIGQSVGKGIFEIGKALKLNDGEIEGAAKDFNHSMEAIRKHFNEMPSDKKDKIIQYASKGAVGLVLMSATIGMTATGMMKFGGTYDPKNPRRKKKFINSKGKGEELGYGEIEVEGVKLGKFFSSLLYHIPLTFFASVSGEMTQNYMDGRGKGEGSSVAAWDAMSKVPEDIYEHSAIKQLLSGDTFFQNLYSSVTTQMALKNLAEANLFGMGFDVDKDGNTVKRKPTNWWEKLLMGTGFGRKFSPKEEDYKQIKAVEKQEDYKKGYQYKKENPEYFQK
jgi:hypothetical protein